MTIKYALTLGVISSLFYSTHVLANPASKDYVDQSIAGLQSQIISLSSTASQLANAMSDLSIKLTSKMEVIQNQVNTLPILTYKIGDIVEGGMVFWVDKSLQHGLVVSLDDLGDNIEWRNGEAGDKTINAHGSGLGAGEMNTRLIISEQTPDDQEGQFAALATTNFQALADGSPCPAKLTAASICYGGWYLPSLYELLLLHANLKMNGLGQVTDDAYWSSTEANTTQAWLVDFSRGEPVLAEKSMSARIRAIHAF